MSENKWIVSSSEEYWSPDGEYATKEEAITHGPEELSDMEKGDGFYVGRKVPYIFNVHKSPESLLEDSFDNDYEKLGEWSEDWQETVLTCKDTEEFIKQKFQEISNFINEKHKARFFNVEDIEVVIYE